MLGIIIIINNSICWEINFCFIVDFLFLTNDSCLLILALIIINVGVDIIIKTHLQ